MNWLNYLSQFFIIAFFVWIGVGRVRDRFRKPPPPPPYIPPRPTGPLLTPPPAPIDRTAFLQARIAYLAHMRDVGIEVEEKDESGSPKKRVRPATLEEMIEFVNLRDGEHAKGLLVTWDAAQQRQKEPV